MRFGLELRVGFGGVEKCGVSVGRSSERYIVVRFFGGVSRVFFLFLRFRDRGVGVRFAFS